MNKLVTSLVTVPIVVGGLISLLIYADGQFSDFVQTPETKATSAQYYLTSQKTDTTDEVLSQLVSIDSNKVNETLTEYQKKKAVVIRHYKIEDPRATPASL